MSTCNCLDLQTLGSQPGGSKYPHRAWLGCQVRWGSFFWPSRFCPLGNFYWFFLVKFGAYVPNLLQEAPYEIK